MTSEERADPALRRPIGKRQGSHPTRGRRLPRSAGDRRLLLAARQLRTPQGADRTARRTSTTQPRESTPPTPTRPNASSITPWWPSAGDPCLDGGRAFVDVRTVADRRGRPVGSGGRRSSYARSRPSSRARRGCGARRRAGLGYRRHQLDHRVLHARQRTWMSNARPWSPVMPSLARGRTRKTAPPTRKRAGAIGRDRSRRARGAGQGARGSPTPRRPDREQRQPVASSTSRGGARTTAPRAWVPPSAPRSSV